MFDCARHWVQDRKEPILCVFASTVEQAQAFWQPRAMLASELRRGECAAGALFRSCTFALGLQEFVFTGLLLHRSMVCCCETLELDATR